MVAPELTGPVLDVGCGEGRLSPLVRDGVTWIGVDASPTMLATNLYRPLVRADMRALPFRDGAVAEVVHFWCLYHVDEPVEAVAEAKRVLRAGGRYYASCGARDSDPELMFEGYPRRRSTPRKRSRSSAVPSRTSNHSGGTAPSTRCARATRCGRTGGTTPSRPSGPKPPSCRSG